MKVYVIWVLGDEEEVGSGPPLLTDSLGNALYFLYKDEARRARDLMREQFPHVIYKIVRLYR